MKVLGGDEVGTPFHEWCFEEWKARYNQKPPWGKEHYIQLNTALKRCENEEAARAAWKAYLADNDNFYAGHYPGKFVAQLARWLPKQPRQRRDKMTEDAKTLALRRIYAEVYRDRAELTETEKRNECSRRFKAQFPTGEVL